MYVCKGIVFPSLPVYTLYDTIIIAWFDDDFRFVVITECLLLKLMEFIFTRQYELLLPGIGLVPVLSCGPFYFLHFCWPLQCGLFCCILHLSYHILAIDWKDCWNHSNYIFVSWVLWSVLAVVCQFVFVPFSLCWSCQNLLFHLTCLK